jgi:hypothetical protein
MGVGEYIEMRKKKEENKKLQFGILFKQYISQ